MANQVAALRSVVTLLRLAIRGSAARLRRGADTTADQQATFEAVLTSLAGSPAASATIADIRFVSVGGDSSGWQAADLDVATGQQVSVLAVGTLWASKALNLKFGPRLGLWLRTGDTGPLIKTPGDAATVTMQSGGPLHIVAKPPGEWADENGAFDDAFQRAGITGSLLVCIIVWKADAVAGLRTMLSGGDYDGIVANALAQASAPVATPKGWSYLWRLGQGAIYADAGGEHGRHIHCHTKEDVGILQFPADFELTDTTKLQWRWKVDKLPCELPEDIQPTHDYLSIAVEFDNGQDLTYMWSGSLAEGTVFRCPLPFWDKVETHWVLRSNPDGLSKWLNEDRPVKSDYARAIGTPPARIVRVWLIAVSVFQRGEGICDYADIELVDGDRRLRVL